LIHKVFFGKKEKNILYVFFKFFILVGIPFGLLMILWPATGIGGAAIEAPWAIKVKQQWTNTPSDLL
jgi:hypothetical protein